jgi:hypothetical protein
MTDRKISSWGFSGYIRVSPPEPETDPFADVDNMSADNLQRVYRDKLLSDKGMQLVSDQSASHTTKIHYTTEAELLDWFD